MVQRRHDGSADRTGFDDTRNYLSDALARLVPGRLARRAVAVEVETDGTEYAVDDPVEITVRLRNRLPVPVELETTTRRQWGWRVDGVLEASDERRYVRSEPGAIAFRAGETKVATATWNGRFRRENGTGLDRSVPADRGEHTVSAFLAVADPAPHHEDSTEIRIR